MPRKAALVMHLLKEELEEKYRREGEPRVKERLLTMLHLYEGRSIRETAKAVRRGERSVKRWLRRWNGKGYEGLIPRFRGGPKPRMEESEWDRVLEEIEGKGMTLRDVTVYVKTTRGVEYSYKMVWHILRKKRKVRYGKPYIQDEKRPENAEEILKKR